MASAIPGLADGICGVGGPRAIHFTHHGNPLLKPIPKHGILTCGPDINDVTEEMRHSCTFPNRNLYSFDYAEITNEDLGTSITDE